MRGRGKRGTTGMAEWCNNKHIPRSWESEKEGQNNMYCTCSLSGTDLFRVEVCGCWMPTPSPALREHKCLAKPSFKYRRIIIFINGSYLRMCVCEGAPRTPLFDSSLQFTSKSFAQLIKSCSKWVFWLYAIVQNM